MNCNQVCLLLSLLLLIQTSIISSYEVTLNSNSKFLSEQTYETPKETKMIQNVTVVNRTYRHGYIFTEGFAFKDSKTLIESSGIWGASFIQLVNVDDITIIKQRALPVEYFGEGCTIINSSAGRFLYQLTYKARKVFLWDPDTLELKNTLPLPPEVLDGWGMAKRTGADGIDEVFISDGSNQIHILDPATFTVRKSLNLTSSSNNPISNLNELEFISGKIWANIWQTNNILVIDPETGFVEAEINLDSIQQEAVQVNTHITFNNETVLNGIAYDPYTDRILITGKFWPLVWQIKVDGL